MPLDAVDTPALLLDLAVFERNLDRLASSLRGAPVRVRPHGKSHKCPEIALRQVARGAVGICCQKVSEAEIFVQAGVNDVLVSNEIAGMQKLERLAQLARRARLGVCVDHPATVADLGRAIAKAGSEIDVYIEVNVGANRCGVEPGAPAVGLAKAIAQCAGLRFAGLQAYQGRAQHLRTPKERVDAIGLAVEKIRQTIVELKAHGFSVDRVTGAGTGTYLLEAGSEVYNEIQPGSYVFMDADYGRNLDESGNPLTDFQQSLFVFATVMSHPTPDRAVVDVGLKAHSIDSGMPLVQGIPGATYVRAADEHGVLTLTDSAQVSLGQKIRLIPGHCDPTVNLHDWLVCYRGDVVEALWPIAARGAFY
jgi:D-serine deaminase-like pyridoxal phosphate-dependent protein